MYFLWGAGVFCEKFINNNKQVLEEISAFIDCDERKWGKWFDKPVLSPQQIGNIADHTIVVMSQQYEKDIINTILSYDIPVENIMPYTTFIHNMMSKGLMFPSKLRIDASTICQLNCKSCYMRLNDSGIVGIGFLKYDDFKKLVDENEFIKRIELSNSGEIFLNPDLEKIIEYSYRKGIQLSACNGVNFNDVAESTLEALVKYRFNKITISIDGATQDVYEQYRRNGDINKVFKNIARVNEYKRKYNCQFPEVTWQYIIMSHNEKDIIKAKKLAEKYQMQIKFKLTWDEDYVPVNADLIKKETGLKFLRRKEQTENSQEENTSFCGQLFDEPQINWDGRLLGCCCVYKMDFGVNVFEVGLKSALNSPYFTHAKKMLLGEEARPEEAEHIPCACCKFYKGK